MYENIHYHCYMNLEYSTRKPCNFIRVFPSNCQPSSRQTAKPKPTDSELDITHMIRKYTQISSPPRTQNRTQNQKPKRKTRILDDTQLQFLSQVCHKNIQGDSTNINQRKPIYIMQEKKKKKFDQWVSRF